MHPRMHTDAYTHTKRAGKLYNIVKVGGEALQYCKAPGVAKPRGARLCNIVKPAHAAPRHREPPGSPAKRIGGSLDVLPTPEGGGTLTAKRSGRASGLYAFRFACMHPYASGDAYIFSFRFGLVPAFRGGLHACMHCMHHSLIGDSGKREGNPLY